MLFMQWRARFDDGMGNLIETRSIRIFGIVQGVGFRPTVKRLADRLGVRGSVCNRGAFVEVVATAEPSVLDAFENQLRENPPQRAVILQMESEKRERVPAESEGDFVILESPLEKATQSSLEKASKNAQEKAVQHADAGVRGIFISPDIAICEDCRRELLDPTDRRFLHPFINCTSCGPRLTILEKMPYDRERTSMRKFPMCPACEREYRDPASRRFDAQPVCCPDCGPQVYVVGPDAAEHAGAGDLRMTGDAETESDARHGMPGLAGLAAIHEARECLIHGGIVAVKGIGGFHLCCDASNDAAVQKLRERKHRPHKPFAVMMRDLAVVKRECEVSQAAEEILTGHQKPILLLEKLGRAVTDSGIVCTDSGLVCTDSGLANKLAGGTDTKPLLCDAVAPGNPKVGVMLPYAPLQILLFEPASLPGFDAQKMPDCLVMTSGNISGAPICASDEEAVAQLTGIADLILSQDREIRIRCDDSVLELFEDTPYMIRRSRGYAPLPVRVPGGVGTAGIVGNAETAEMEAGRNFQEQFTGQGVLAIGGELKNTFCISRGDLMYPSAYVGDLSDARAEDVLRQSLERMEVLMDTKISAIVCDLHPGYHSGAIARRIASERSLKLLEVQHHYAHVLACMAENQWTEPVWGISFDGTGYGTDGTVWGGEILAADADGFERVGHVEPFLQVGGDVAPRQGWRIAVAMLGTCGTGAAGQIAPEDGMDDGMSGVPALAEQLGLCTTAEAGMLLNLARNGIQTITSTSCGRVFDAAAAVLGIRRESGYEGEAANALMFAALEGEKILKSGEREKGNAVAEKSADYKTSSESGLLRQAPVEAGKETLLRTTQMIRELAARRLPGEAVPVLAYRFHEALAEEVRRVMVLLRQQELQKNPAGSRAVALTGGCFQNSLLLRLTKERLEAEGFEVLRHHLIPPNDGGIALGQAYFGVRQMQKS